MLCVQGRWLLYEATGDTFDSTPTVLYAFDFATLTWSKEALIGEALRPRDGGMQACHDGALVCLGGGELLALGKVDGLMME